MYRYATFKTRAMAMNYLENMYAMGTATPCEIAGVFYEGKRWHIMMKL